MSFKEEMDGPSIETDSTNLGALNLVQVGVESQFTGQDVQSEIVI